MKSLLLKNALIFDGVSEERSLGHVVVEQGLIKEVADTLPTGEFEVTLDVQGRTLMPGLIDAHIHAYFPDVDAGKVDKMPMTLVAHHARRMLEASLQRGFTSVRDCGGGDYGLYLAIERGWIAGPRLFYCGKALSQSGGHGDKRLPHEEIFCGCGIKDPLGCFEGHRTRVVDGPENLRLAVREELRRGASFIKIMGSGGVASPADPIKLAQYSADEISAVVDEVERHDTYVTAHIHPDGALRRCIELGVRCIEHGTLITDDTAALAAERDVSIVPTLAVIDALSRFGHEAGFPPVSQAKLAAIQPLAIGSLERMKRAGVRMGFGTDLIGQLDKHQCLEFSLRSQVLTPLEILRSATSINAQILRAENKIGRIATGLIADMIVVDGDPLADIGLLAQDGRKVPVVLKDGQIFKNELNQIAG
ncbi:metal-dependent hydrolase family protein [Tsuneonella rigui]|uniref:metal-dependent hydrolase family protein n=1 Tax=Tsuneonella rigui TaxID=1708790 RepID=UPI000F7F6556|nr:amidohydrolase family protein [Tsuneonella rigui]